MANQEQPHGAAGSWFGWAVPGKKYKKAHLGEENRMYYNAELKMWVEKGKEDEARQQAVAAAPPIMPTVAGSNGSADRPKSTSTGGRRAGLNRYAPTPNLSVNSAATVTDIKHFMPIPVASASTKSPPISSSAFRLAAEPTKSMFESWRPPEATTTENGVLADSLLGTHVGIDTEPQSQRSVDNSAGVDCDVSNASQVQHPSASDQATLDSTLTAACASGLEVVQRETDTSHVPHLSGQNGWPSPGAHKHQYMSDSSSQVLTSSPVAPPPLAAPHTATSSPIMPAAAVFNSSGAWQCNTAGTCLLAPAAEPRDEAEADFLRSLHPGQLGKLDGPLPWDLPVELRNTDQFISLCINWNHIAPQGLYHPDMLRATHSNQPSPPNAASPESKAQSPVDLSSFANGHVSPGTSSPYDIPPVASQLAVPSESASTVPAVDRDGEREVPAHTSGLRMLKHAATEHSQPQAINVITQRQQTCETSSAHTTHSTSVLPSVGVAQAVGAVSRQQWDVLSKPCDHGLLPDCRQTADGPALVQGSVHIAEDLHTSMQSNGVAQLQTTTVTFNDAMHSSLQHSNICESNGRWSAVQPSTDPEDIMGAQGALGISVDVIMQPSAPSAPADDGWQGMATEPAGNSSAACLVNSRDTQLYQAAGDLEYMLAAIREGHYVPHMVMQGEGGLIQLIDRLRVICDSCHHNSQHAATVAEQPSRYAVGGETVTLTEPEEGMSRMEAQDREEQQTASLLAAHEAQLAELTARYEARMVELEHQYQAQLEEAEEEIANLQEELGTLFISGGKEQRKIHILCDALRAHNLDPDAFLAPLADSDDDDDAEEQRDDDGIGSASEDGFVTKGHLGGVQEQYGRAAGLCV